jgi:hypothetical protein
MPRFVCRIELNQQAETQEFKDFGHRVKNWIDEEEEEGGPLIMPDKRQLESLLRGEPPKPITLDYEVTFPDLLKRAQEATGLPPIEFPENYKKGIRRELGSQGLWRGLELVSEALSREQVTEAVKRLLEGAPPGIGEEVKIDHVEEDAEVDDDGDV